RPPAPDTQCTSPVQRWTDWLGQPDDIAKIAVLQPGRYPWRRQACLSNGPVIASGDRAATSQETLQTGHLAQADGGLHVRHPVVERRLQRLLLVVLAEGADAAHNRCITPQDHASLPGRQQFRGVEGADG